MEQDPFDDLASFDQNTTMAPCGPHSRIPSVPQLVYVIRSVAGVCSVPRILK